MIYEFHTFSMNLFLMFEFNCVAEEREAGAPHSSAARAQLIVQMLNLRRRGTEVGREREGGEAGLLRMT